MKAAEFDSVVILSPYFWNFRDDMWQTTHHIAKEFARLCPTMLVEPGIQWNPRSEQFRADRLLHSLFGARTRSPRANLVIFHRRGPPFGRSKLVRDFALAHNARSLSRLLKRLGFRRTLLWHSFPYWSEPFVGAVDHELFVYHCLDHSTREEEIGLIRRADAVLCVSETLVEKHRVLNPHTYLFPNGVDLSLFNREQAAASSRPPDLPVNERIIGFVGSINCHVDLELLLSVATEFSNDYVVLVGRVLTNETAPRGRQKEALDRLQSLGNVRILGFKPTQQLPIYIEAFDVCLIPFLKNRFNQQADPLKLYQYLALGKPVVTAPVPAAERYRDLCYVADSPTDFIRCISLALTEAPNGLSEARIALARTHSWDSLVARACELLEKATKDERVPEAIKAY